ncbi:hypothetical protein F5Y19DRAFT_466017 [Xylariaceae sp. FL1651]|nr:hypothetical protein F5Y19DRAFT_466017 [Xylariaceae sp. FL1651]
MTFPTIRSAASRFSSIDELLLILAEYVNDRNTLWSLCLSNWRLNRIFTAKLFEPVVLAVGRHQDEASVERIFDGLLKWPYLHNLRQLQLVVNNGPVFPEQTLAMIEKLLKQVPALRMFSCESTHGDIPVSTLAQLSQHCRRLEELHLRCGPERAKRCYGGLGELPSPPPTGWRCIVKWCRKIEAVRMMHLAQAPPRGSGIPRQLEILIVREERLRLQTSRPLQMVVCYSRSPRMTGPCDVCQRPWKRRWGPCDTRYQDCLPWAAGKAQQFLVPGQVRHVTYEYPRPEPADSPAVLLDEETCKFIF